jgi:hypothetical protein
MSCLKTNMFIIIFSYEYICIHMYILYNKLVEEKEKEKER